MTKVTAAPSRIGAAFAAARAEDRSVLMPYACAGFPDLPTSERTVRQIAAAGADLIEIGVPFSDPLADGTTVQRASQAALAHGVTLTDCLALVTRLRHEHGVTIPLLLMGYYNPILQYGIDRFAADAATAGVDGVIVPDLPVEESAELAAACRAHGRDLIFMVAPTSTDARITAIAAAASGFIYCVSLTGVTGSRHEIPDIQPYLARVRSLTSLPLAVGFGISTPAQAHQVATLAEGVVVGSALINRMEAVAAPEMPAAAAAFVRDLKTGVARRPLTPALAAAVTE